MCALDGAHPRSMNTRGAMKEGHGLLRLVNGPAPRNAGEHPVHMPGDGHLTAFVCVQCSLAPHPPQLGSEEHLAASLVSELRTTLHASEAFADDELTDPPHAQGVLASHATELTSNENLARLAPVQLRFAAHPAELAGDHLLRSVSSLNDLPLLCLKATKEDADLNGDDMPPRCKVVPSRKEASNVCLKLAQTGPEPGGEASERFLKLDQTRPKED